jgi:hypothetical protein
MGPESNGHHFPDLDLILERHLKDKKRGWAEECPAIEELLEYIDGGLDQGKVPVILNHLPLCDTCRDLVLAFNLPLPEPAEAPPAWQEFKGKLPEDLRPRSARWWGTLGAWLRDGSLWGIRRWRPVSTLAAGAALASILLFNLYPTPLSRLAYIAPYTSHDTRGIENPVDLYHAYYHKGLDALLSAQFWKLKRVNEARVDEGIRYLEKAKTLAEEDKNQTHVVDCQFYLGMAYLKKNDIAQARKQFEAITKLSGLSTTALQRRHEAEKILQAIDKAESPSR